MTIIQNPAQDKASIKDRLKKVPGQICGNTATLWYLPFFLVTVLHNKNKQFGDATAERKIKLFLALIPLVPTSLALTPIVLPGLLTKETIQYLFSACKAHRDDQSANATATQQPAVAKPQYISGPML